jgi:putative pyrimidine permease RutG
MSTMAPAEQEGGYFPHWKEKTGGVIMPEERLPWGQTIISGLQHSVAMAGATIIAPLIMGFDPNLALFFSGVGTLIFFVVVGGRVPSYLGSSFSFIAVVIAASGYAGHGPNPGIDIALGGPAPDGNVLQAFCGPIGEDKVYPKLTYRIALRGGLASARPWRDGDN